MADKLAGFTADIPEGLSSALRGLAATEKAVADLMAWRDRATADDRGLIADLREQIDTLGEVVDAVHASVSGDMQAKLDLRDEAMALVSGQAELARTQLKRAEFHAEGYKVLVRETHPVVVDSEEGLLAEIIEKMEPLADVVFPRKLSKSKLNAVVDALLAAKISGVSRGTVVTVGVKALDA